MRFTDKSVTVNKVIYYSYNYTILLIIINLVKINLQIYGQFTKQN